MRAQLCNALARYAGQTITREIAAQLVLELFPPSAHEPAQFGVKEYRGYLLQCERFADAQEELHGLHVRHYAETEKYRAGIPLDMNYEAFKERDRAGGLLQFTARVKETGELVGNMRVYLARSMHTQTLISTEDTFYVVPEHRGGMMAVRLWQFAEAAGKSIGVREAYFDSKLVNKAGRMAEYLGYTAFATKYVKIFD